MVRGVYKRYNGIKCGFQKDNHPKNEFKKGHIPWNKGRKGLQIPWNKGKIGIYSEEYRKKIGLASSINTKKHWIDNPERRRKQSEIMKGNKHSLGFKRTKTTREKDRLSSLGKNNANWQGGISFEPYSMDWTDDLRKMIRKRDNYTDQLTGKKPAFCVHHIDYNKKNCDPKNLITLSRSSNSKVNSNRKYWTNYFQQKCLLLV